MSNATPTLALALCLLLAGCATPPLPPGEIPQDFLFTFTWERGSGQATAGEPVPKRIHLAADVAGAIQYEVEHASPAPAVKKSEVRLDEQAIGRLYEAVRAADLYMLDEAYEGPDSSFGTRTFFVIGRNHPRTVVAKNVTVPALETLQATIFPLLPAEVFAYPATRERTVVMDMRTYVFHRGDCAEVEKIPADARRVLLDPWAALNEGGRPAPDCQPLKSWE